MRQQLETQMAEVSEGITCAHGLRSEFRYQRGYPATVNAATEANLCALVARRLVGDGKIHTDLRPSMGGEDFAYFAEQRPSCYVWIGNGSGEGGCTLHNPRYDFNDTLLPIGASYWVRLAETALA